MPSPAPFFRKYTKAPPREEKPRGRFCWEEWMESKREYGMIQISPI